MIERKKEVKGESILSKVRKASGLVLLSVSSPHAFLAAALLSLFSKQWVSEWTGLTWLIRFWFLLLPGRRMLFAPELNHLLGMSRHVRSSGVLLEEVKPQLSVRKEIIK